MERGHATSVEACKALVESLMRGSELNYVGHSSCKRKSSNRVRKAIDKEESDPLAERKVEVVGQ